MTANPEYQIIYGRQPVTELLRSNYRVLSIYIAHDSSGKIVNQILRLAERKNIPIKTIPKNDIQKLTGPVVHQGIAAKAEALHLNDQIELFSFIRNIENPFLLIMDQVQDPHNMGAIIRTAEIAGVNAIILPEKGSAQLNATVAKTSAGALFHLPIFQVNDLYTAIDSLNGTGINTWALMPGSEKSMYDTNLKKPLALVIGSEGEGVRKNIAKICTGKITIPQFGKIESLNASVASAVVLYEVVRQRKS
ncbi:MAG: 23S rRNA (guanosine(2251)-2'-O)-methyltransferase RlmB [Calditrichae bacterium]|nr:23S rRNA (guanosine(2251)-2'-O)-methyltransferase RlmB [Calditrichota bacterium]MCB9057841.1 23S rRNA (guanosine(2251)-2'-O)-methyltransferase RlmB [Calditrichia bacterium]